MAQAPKVVVPTGLPESAGCYEVCHGLRESDRDWPKGF